MNLRSTDGGACTRSRWALLGAASAVLLFSAAAAQAQHLHGFAGARHSGNFAGVRHNAVAVRGFHHHRGFVPFVVVGGTAFLYPYPYPYYAAPYYGDPALAMPTYNLPPPGSTWYYCEAAGAYYPYVTTCDGGWKVVPATPQPAYPAPQQ